MFTSTIQSIKSFGSNFFKNIAINSSKSNEDHSIDLEQQEQESPSSWHGFPLPTAYLNNNGKVVFRDIAKKTIVKGKVIQHVGVGVLISTPSGEVGLVEHVELDWSPKVGRKYFPIGAEFDVMVLSSPGTSRLYLSIREANFSEYFKNSLSKLPIGKKMLRHVSGVVDYGFFVNVQPGIDVLIHQTEAPNFSNFRIGDLVEIKITSHDCERNRLMACLA